MILSQITDGEIIDIPVINCLYLHLKNLCSLVRFGLFDKEESSICEVSELWDQ